MTEQHINDRIVLEALDALFDRRAAGATVCPSDVARSLVDHDGDWRALMPGVRAAAQRLAESGRLRVTRHGTRIEATQGGGPIRLGRPLQTDES